MDWWLERPIRQPGPASAPRRDVVAATGGRDLLLRLEKGVDLIDGLTSALVAAGQTRASLVLLGGRLAGLSYFTGEIDHSRARVATYGVAKVLTGPVTLIGGNANLGAGPDGRPLMHCHAVFMTAAGALTGGHVIGGACPVEGGVTALVLATEGAGFAVGPDAETNYEIFLPGRSAP